MATEATFTEVHSASRTPSLFQAATHHLVVNSLMGKAPEVVALTEFAITSISGR